MASSTTKGKKKRASKDPERQERNKRIAIGACVILGGAAVFAGAGLGVKTLDEQAAACTLVGAPDVEIVWPSDKQGNVWMPRSERRRIQELIDNAVLGTAALSVTPLKEASLALRGTGWVEGDPVARWADDGTVRLSADWRVPAAAVVVGEQETLIDWDAHVLPISYMRGASNQFYIRNTATTNPGVGNVWDEPEIADALALRRVLAQKGLLSQIEGVDLGEGREHGILHLLTNGDARIVWGGGPGRERPAEMPTDVKLDRLVELQTKTGRVDASVRIVDIRGQHILMQRHER